MTLEKICQTGGNGILFQRRARREIRRATMKNVKVPGEARRRHQKEG